MKEIQRKLRKMESRLRKRIVRRSLRRGIKPIREAAKAKAPRGTRAKESKPLHKTIVTRSQRRRRGRDEISVKVTHTQDGAHAHLVEHGTGPRYMPDGKYVGEMPAQPYMRPAYDANKAKAQRIVRDELKKAIETEALR